MSKFKIVREYFAFLRKYKKWWILPIAFFLVLFGLLLAFAQGSVLAPFIYTLF